MQTRYDAWTNTVLIARLMHQSDLTQEMRSEYAQAHILHVLDCTLHALQDRNNREIQVLQQQEHSILADQDAPALRAQRRGLLVVGARRARLLHVMLQLLLCNGAPTSEFSIKACQYARTRSVFLMNNLPAMRWSV